MGFQAKTFVAILMVLLFCLGKKCGCSLTEIRSSKVGVSLKFLVVGDWGRQGLYNQSQVAVQMGRIGENLDIDFVISTGDNFYDEGLKGTDDSQFQESFSQIYTAPSLNKTWYTVLGNHDYRGDVLAQLSSDLKHKDPRWICRRSFRLSYSICSPSTTPRDCNAVDFFFLDTTPFVDKYFLPSHHKYDWRGVLPRERYLAQQLKDLSGALGASTAQWKIVVGHHTIRSVGSHGDTQELVQQLLPVLQTHGVDLYINGHDHCLEHISSLRSPLQFLTSGGGSKAWRGINGNSGREGLRFFHDGQGFASVEIQPHSLHVAFYDVDGDVIHELDLMKG